MVYVVTTNIVFAFNYEYMAAQKCTQRNFMTLYNCKIKIFLLLNNVYIRSGTQTVKGSCAGTVYGPHGFLYFFIE